jgi:hypothetical protein
MSDLKPPFTRDIPIRIDRNIRISGLLARLSPQDLQTLVCLLTYADRDGRCMLSGRDVGRALNLSEKQGMERLKRLRQLRFHGKPLMTAEGGKHLRKFARSRYRILPTPGLQIRLRKPRGELAEDRRSPSQEALFPLPPGETVKFPAPGGRSGKPASESPADTAGSNSVGNYNNKTTEQTRDEGEVKEGEKESPFTQDFSKGLGGLLELLRSQGVSEPMAVDMVRSYPAERIRKQVEMLPYRDARDPAAMLVKAIREDWNAPSAYRAALREKAAKREREEAQSTDEAKQRARQRRIKEAMSKLSPEEMQDVTARAREKVKAALNGALGDRIPQRLVDAQVKKIIAEEYLAKGWRPKTINKSDG